MSTNRLTNDISDALPEELEGHLRVDFYISIIDSCYQKSFYWLYQIFIPNHFLLSYDLRS